MTSGDKVTISLAPENYWTGKQGTVLGKLRYGTEYAVTVGSDVLYLPESALA